jgi:hypothetical protein
MAPLPPNSTGRVWFDYVTGVGATSQEHSVMFRISDFDTDGDSWSTGFLGVLNGFGAGAFREGWKVLRGRVSAPGSNISLPFTPNAALRAFLGTAVAGGTAVAEALEDTVQGRSLTTGRRVDFSLYKGTGFVDPTFRYGAPPALLTALSSLNIYGLGAVIDGTLASWYTYVNQNYNSYWERELRS